MKSRYKIIISNKNLYKEFELSNDKDELRVGTGVGCDFRLHKDLFFEQIELIFSRNLENWSLFCSDNLYISVGDSRKLMTITPNHGEVFWIKYQESNNDVFSIEFLIDFDNGKRKYERAIDILDNSDIKIGTDNSNQIVLSSPYVKNDLIELKLSIKSYELYIRQTTYGIYHNGSKVVNDCTIKNGDFFQYLILFFI